MFLFKIHVFYMFVLIVKMDATQDIISGTHVSVLSSQSVVYVFICIVITLYYIWLLIKAFCKLNSLLCLYPCITIGF